MAKDHDRQSIEDHSCSGKLDLKEDLDEVLQTLIRTVPARIEKSDGIIHIYVKH